MTPRPPAVRALTSYATGREDYATDFAAGVVYYTAPCATCWRMASYLARPSPPLTVACPTCEAGAA